MSFIYDPVFVMYAVPIGITCIAIAMWFRYCWSPPTHRTEEHYPPEGLNCLEVAYIRTGTAYSKDIAPLLIELAKKGYIELPQKPVALSGLKHKLAPIMKHIMQIISSNDHYTKVFDNNSRYVKIVMYMMMVAVYACMLCLPTYAYLGRVDHIIWLLALIPVFSCALFDSIVITLIVCVPAVPIFLMVFFSTSLWDAVRSDGLYLRTVLCSLACLVAMYRIYVWPRKRTPYGRELFGRIKGFKHFLETAQPAQLEPLLAENPNYFSDMLPYAYIFGLTDTWCSKFYNTPIKQPDWFIGISEFDSVTARRFMHSSMHAMQRCINAAATNQS